MIIIRKNQEKFFSEFLEQKEFFNMEDFEKKVAKRALTEQEKLDLIESRKNAAALILAERRKAATYDAVRGMSYGVAGRSTSNQYHGAIKDVLTGRGWDKSIKEVSDRYKEEAEKLAEETKKPLSEVEKKNILSEKQVQERLKTDEAYRDVMESKHPELKSSSSTSNTGKIKDNFFKRNKKALLIGGGLTAAAGLGGLYMHNRNK